MGAEDVHLSYRQRLEILPAIGMFSREPNATLGSNPINGFPKFRDSIGHFFRRHLAAEQMADSEPMRRESDHRKKQNVTEKISNPITWNSNPSRVSDVANDNVIDSQRARDDQVNIRQHRNNERENFPEISSGTDDDLGERD